MYGRGESVEPGPARAVLSASPHPPVYGGACRCDPDDRRATAAPRAGLGVSLPPAEPVTQPLRFFADRWPVSSRPTCLAADRAPQAQAMRARRRGVVPTPTPSRLPPLCQNTYQDTNPEATRHTGPGTSLSTVARPSLPLQDGGSRSRAQASRVRSGPRASVSAGESGSGQVERSLPRGLPGPCLRAPPGGKDRALSGVPLGKANRWPGPARGGEPSGANPALVFPETLIRR